MCAVSDEADALLVVATVVEGASPPGGSAGVSVPGSAGIALSAGLGSCSSARVHASNTNLLNSSGLSRYTW